MQEPRPAHLKWGLVVPYATVCASSLCIMVTELTASRLIARYLGASLYTWTSVIGIVLVGIALGNYLGGRLADRWTPRHTLIGLLLFAAAGCAGVPYLNQMLGEGLLLGQMSWQLRTFLHVGALFLVPSAFLGMISPVVAKWALDQGLRTGQTLGGLYAWSAVGSIVGTFLTGFVLIPMLGTLTIMHAVAIVLAGLGLLFLLKGRGTRGLVMAGTVLACMGFAAQGWTLGSGPMSPGSPGRPPHVLYERDSQYSYIQVESLPHAPDIRILKLGQLAHNKVDMRDPANLKFPEQYAYMKIFGAMTDLVASEKSTLRTYFLGGGGYVLPRYVQRHWPGSHIEVVEIDPAVTDVAMEHLGLSRDHGMNIVHRDARNHVDDLLWRQQQGEEVGGFNIIYGDTYNDLAVPFHLTTFEFNEKLRDLLADDGIYLLNMIDVPSSGRFLGAVYATLRKTFPHVYVLATDEELVKNRHTTFVVVGALQPLGLSALTLPQLSVKVLSASRLAQYEEHAKGLYLSDDYAPVEALLGPVVKERWRTAASAQMIETANILLLGDEFEKAIRTYRRSLARDPSIGLEVHTNIGSLLARQGQFKDAVKEYREALRLDPNFPTARIGIGNALAQLGQFEDALEHYQEAMRLAPNAVEAHVGFGNAKLHRGKFAQAAVAYRAALRLDPQYVEVHNNLGQALLRQGLFGLAVEQFKLALALDPDFMEAERNIELALQMRELVGNGHN